MIETKKRMVYLACLAACVNAVAAAPELTMAATVAAGPPYDEESRTYIQVRPPLPAVDGTSAKLYPLISCSSQHLETSSLMSVALFEMCAAAQLPSILASSV